MKIMVTRVALVPETILPSRTLTRERDTKRERQRVRQKCTPGWCLEGKQSNVGDIHESDPVVCIPNKKGLPALDTYTHEHDPRHTLRKTARYGVASEAHLHRVVRCHQGTFTLENKHICGCLFGTVQVARHAARIYTTRNTTHTTHTLFLLLVLLVRIAVWLQKPQAHHPSPQTHFSTSTTGYAFPRNGKPCVQTLNII